MTIDGIINPASSEYIQKMIEEASAAEAQCLVIQLDTPGGLVESTRDITKSMLGAPLPVVVYVAPSGARAASAGTFITMAGHVAAMAPGTNIGAASVVSMMSQSDSMSSVMMRKATNDAVAMIKSIAEERGRNAEWAEIAVTEAASITASEALDLNVVDFIASSLDSLLILIDGKTVLIDEERITLETADANITFFEMPLRFKILDKISDPTIAYFLFIIGLYGIFFELYNPGAVFPGVIGAICLLMFFYAMNTLPVNYAGVLFIILAVILFLLEIKVTSYGVLTIGGAVAFVMGSVMLYDSDLPFMRVSWSIIATFTISTTLFFAFALGLGLRAQKRKPAIGREYLIEADAVVLDDFQDGCGQILFEGEIWQANTSDLDIQKDDIVKVIKIDGLNLTVKKKN